MFNNRFLFDTHTLIWWWTSPSELSIKALDILNNTNNQIFVSTTSIWEISIKYHKGNLPKGELILANLDSLMIRDSFLKLDMLWEHALLAGKINNKHADPFDRMLVAQAKIENLTIITIDSKIHEFDVNWVW